MTTSIRARVDTELTRRVGTWFTVREIQNKLRINPATLKPLLMKYARENLLKRRKVKGTARSVQFTPSKSNRTLFQKELVNYMPYRNFTGARGTKIAAKKGRVTRKTTTKSRKAATTKRRRTTKRR